ncbi:MAG: zinc-ribbon domain-containing protein [Candidatus Bathyarchaeia archaeon]
MSAENNSTQEARKQKERTRRSTVGIPKPMFEAVKKAIEADPNYAGVSVHDFIRAVISERLGVSLRKAGPSFRRERETMFCDHCGVSILRDSKFCDECGTEQP